MKGGTEGLHLVALRRVGLRGGRDGRAFLGWTEFLFLKNVKLFSRKCHIYRNALLTEKNLSRNLRPKTVASDERDAIISSL